MKNKVKESKIAFKDMDNKERTKFLKERRKKWNWGYRTFVNSYMLKILGIDHTIRALINYVLKENYISEYTTEIDNGTYITKYTVAPQSEYFICNLKQYIKIKGTEVEFESNPTWEELNCLLNKILQEFEGKTLDEKVRGMGHKDMWFQIESDSLLCIPYTRERIIGGIQRYMKKHQLEEYRLKLEYSSHTSVMQVIFNKENGNYDIKQLIEPSGSDKSFYVKEVGTNMLDELYKDMISNI